MLRDIIELLVVLVGLAHIFDLGERFRRRDRKTAQKRLDQIAKPGFIEREKWLRDSRALVGCLCVAGYLWVDNQRFISFYPNVQKSNLITSVLLEYSLGLVGPLHLLCFGPSPNDGPATT
jgi:hypothetical protein